MANSSDEVRKAATENDALALALPQGYEDARGVREFTGRVLVLRMYCRTHWSMCRRPVSRRIPSAEAGGAVFAFGASSVDSVQCTMNKL